MFALQCREAASKHERILETANRQNRRNGRQQPEVLLVDHGCDERPPMCVRKIASKETGTKASPESLLPLTRRWRRRRARHGTLAVLVLSALCWLGLAWPLRAAERATATITTSADSADEIHGVTTVNGLLAPRGVEITFAGEADGVRCGQAVTQDHGTFSFEPRCEAGTSFVARLPALSDLTSDGQYVFDPLFNNIAVTFTGLTDEQRAVLGFPVDAAATDAPESVPLLDGTGLAVIMGLVIIASALVIVWLVQEEKVKKDVRRQTEAMVLVAVIIAVIILGLTAKIGGDGLISVLAAVVGWTAGRATADGAERSANSADDHRRDDARRAEQVPHDSPPDEQVPHGSPPDPTGSGEG